MENPTFAFISTIASCLAVVVAVISLVTVIWKGGKMWASYDLRISENHAQICSLPCVRDPDYAHDRGSLDTTVSNQQKILDNQQKLLDGMSSRINILEIQVGKQEEISRLQSKNIEAMTKNIENLQEIIRNGHR